MEEKWMKVIKSNNSLWDIPVKEVWNYRDLCFMHVKKNILMKYKQTILGPVYIFLSPILTSGIFWLVFSKAFGIPTDGTPELLFYMLGNVFWALLAGCVSDNAFVLKDNAYLMGKVYFPRLVIPLANSIGKLVHFGIQFLLFVLLFAGYLGFGADLSPNIWLLIIPVLIFQTMLLGTGLGMFISAVSTKYRDLSMAVGLLLQLWMYLTPVIYPIVGMPETLRGIILLNPMTSVIEIARYAFFGRGYVSVGSLFLSTLFTVLVFMVGLLSFNKVEKKFVDAI